MYGQIYDENGKFTQKHYFYLNIWHLRLKGRKKTYEKNTKLTPGK